MIFIRISSELSTIASYWDMPYSLVGLCFGCILISLPLRSADIYLVSIVLGLSGFSQTLRKTPEKLFLAFLGLFSEFIKRWERTFFL